nr:MAG TPA_asm: N acetylmuramoyl L alanine amidase endolysin [Caudoviricetes sp.]
MNYESLTPDGTLLLNKHYTPGRAGHRIEFIVLHHNAGNLSARDCWNTWQTRQASAHYQVDAAGAVWRLVNDQDTAWHAGDLTANQRSIGIEHADISSSPWTISDATLDAGAHLVAALCRRYQLGRPEWGRNVFPHNHFSATACPASIAGSQNAAYMARAQQYYDQLGGTDMPAKTDPVNLPNGGQTVTVEYMLQALMNQNTTAIAKIDALGKRLGPVDAKKMPYDYLPAILNNLNSLFSVVGKIDGQGLSDDQLARLADSLKTGLGEQVAAELAKRLAD